MLRDPQICGPILRGPLEEAAGGDCFVGESTLLATTLLARGQESRLRGMFVRRWIIEVAEGPLRHSVPPPPNPTSIGCFLYGLDRWYTGVRTHSIHMTLLRIGLAQVDLSNPLAHEVHIEEAIDLRWPERDRGEPEGLPDAEAHGMEEHSAVDIGAT